MGQEAQRSRVSVFTPRQSDQIGLSPTWSDRDPYLDVFGLGISAVYPCRITLPDGTPGD